MGKDYFYSQKRRAGNTLSGLSASNLWEEIPKHYVGQL